MAGPLLVARQPSCCVVYSRAFRFCAWEVSSDYMWSFQLVFSKRVYILEYGKALVITALPDFHLDLPFAIFNSRRWHLFRLDVIESATKVMQRFWRRELIHWRFLQSAKRYRGDPAEPPPLGFRPSFNVNFGLGAGGGGGSIVRWPSSTGGALPPWNGPTLAAKLSCLTAGIEIGGSGAGP